MANPCDACPRACGPALERALAGDDWRLWLAVRDACPLGAEHRYSEEQVRYHYTKDVDALRAAVLGRRGAR
jgi:methylmalonic aciduria homocystinuria type C protein